TSGSLQVWTRSPTSSARRPRRTKPAPGTSASSNPPMDVASQERAHLPPTGNLLLCTTSRDRLDRARFAAQGCAISAASRHLTSALGSATGCRWEERRLTCAPDKPGVEMQPILHSCPTYVTFLLLIDGQQSI